MLDEYFSMKFELRVNELTNSKDLFLKGLPVLLKGHSPCPHGLPMFLFRLATQIKWKEEQSCFKGICTELGLYYGQIQSTESLDLGKEQQRILQHLLFPALRYNFMPPKELAYDGSFTKLALLSKLYKVFERC
jgi:DNA mismatch repair protein MLH1